MLVLVAARDLFPGVTIEEEDLYAVEIPPQFLPEHVFLSPEYVVGAVPHQRILANEYVRSERLNVAAPTSPVPIPAGSRVVPLAGVAGVLVDPGAEVGLARSRRGRCTIAARATVAWTEPELGVVLPIEVAGEALRALDDGVLTVVAADASGGRPCSR